MKKQFQELPEITLQIEVLRDATAGIERGGIVELSVVDRVLGSGCDDHRKRYIIHKLRRHLRRDRGIETWAIPGVGIKLLTDEECLTVAARKRTRRAVRQHAMAVRAATNSRAENLTDRQRMLAMTIIQQSTEAIKTAKLIKKPDECESPRSLMMKALS